MKGIFSALLLVILLFYSGRGYSGTSESQGVRSFELRNGMKVYVVPDHRLPVVMHILVYKVGGVDDPRGLSGMAHYFEHLMFSGTEKYPKFDEVLDGLGGRFNAGTGREFTVYYELVNKQHLPLIMSMEADRMQYLKPTDQVIERERNVVLEERKMRVESTQRGVIREEVESVFFHKNGYGASVVGWEHEMANYDRAAVDIFYDEHYSPNNAILLLVGDVDYAQVFKLADKYYGKIPNRNKLGKKRFPVRLEPSHRSDIVVRLAHPSVSHPESLVLYRAPSFKTTRDFKARAATAMAADIVSGDGFGVLYDELVRERSLALGVAASYEYGDGMVVLKIDPKLDSVPEAVNREAKAIIARLISNGVSEEQVQSAKYRNMASLMYVLDGMDKAWFYAELLAFGVEIQSPDEYSRALESITVEDVNRALKNVFSGATVEAYLVHKAEMVPDENEQAQSQNEASVEGAL